MSAPPRKPDPSRPTSGTTPARDSLVRWEGGSIPVADLVQAAPFDLGYELVLWVESGSERVVGVRFARSGTGEEVVGDLLQEAMHRPATGAPGRPAEVLVTDATLASGLQERVASQNIQVRLVDHCPGWNAVRAEFGAFLAAHWPGRSYLDGENMTPADVERFFQAAATFYRRAPWLTLEESPIELRLAERAEPLYAVVMGQDRMMHGLNLYLSEASFRHRLPRAEHPMRTRGTVAVTFDREDGIPPPMVEERRSYRWPLAGPAAFPLPYRQLADGTMCEPDAEELGLLSLALHAVAELAERYPGSLQNRRRIVEAVQVPGASGDSIARLTFPAELEDDDPAG
jgi:hypothetical protein